MFDTRYQTYETHHHTTIKKESSLNAVVEASKLLHGLEKEAKEKILSCSLDVAGNDFKFITAETGHAIVDNVQIVFAMFTLNGKEHKIRVESKDARWKPTTIEIYRAIATAVADDITEVIFNAIYPKIEVPRR